jgi:hypothetical protein
MKIHLRFLRHATMHEQALQDDGWHLEPQNGGGLVARHPEVKDEGAARTRLYRLGFLTSSSLHIDFGWVRKSV